MQNPKTTLAGYIGLLGVMLSVVGSMRPSTSWGATFLQLGSLLSGGGASVAAISARDGGH